MHKQHKLKRNETLKPSQTTTYQPSRVPLVITYNPALRSMSTIIKSLPRDATAFQTPLVAFRRTDNLSDVLVTSKLRTDTQTNVYKGSFR